MPSSDAPDPPDYVGAAKEQGKFNLLAAIQSAYANNPNVINPYGTQGVTWDIKKDKQGNIISAKPTITQKLSKEQQKLFAQANLAKGNISQSAIGTSKQLQKALATPFDTKSLGRLPGVFNMGTPQKYRDDIIAAMMSRVNKDYGIQRNDVNSELIAAGLRPGTEAYENAMMRIDRNLNDARQQAILAGGQEATRDFEMKRTGQAQTYQQGMGNRQQALSEMTAKRQAPINEFSALQSGSQINNPFAGNLGFQPGTNVQAPNYAGAVAQQGQTQQNQYNQRQAYNNNLVSSGAGLIGSLGGAAIMR
jgi:hypothetical protein